MECFCGNKHPKDNSEVNESRCDTICPGDSHSKCGGYLAMNIYQTGVIPFGANLSTVDDARKAEVSKNPVRIVYLVSPNFMLCMKGQI